MSTLDSASNSPALDLLANHTLQLQQTQPWVRFLSIVGFISAGFMIVAGIAAGVFGIATGHPNFAVFLVVHPLLGVLYFFPSLYLLRYADKIREFVASREEAQLEAALNAQRSFWKLVGVITATFLGVFLLAMLIGLVAAVVSHP